MARESRPLVHFLNRAAARVCRRRDCGDRIPRVAVGEERRLLLWDRISALRALLNFVPPPPPILPPPSAAQKPPNRKSRRLASDPERRRPGTVGARSRSSSPRRRRKPAARFTRSSSAMSRPRSICRARCRPKVFSCRRFVIRRSRKARRACASPSLLRTMSSRSAHWPRRLIASRPAR